MRIYLRKSFNNILIKFLKDYLDIKNIILGLLGTKIINQPHYYYRLVNHENF